MLGKISATIAAVEFQGLKMEKNKNFDFGNLSETFCVTDNLEEIIKKICFDWS